MAKFVFDPRSMRCENVDSSMDQVTTLVSRKGVRLRQKKT